MPGGVEFETLNSLKFIYLRELSEPRDNSLRVVVDEAVEIRSDKATLSIPELPELQTILKHSQLIDTTEDCRRFELFWAHVAAYLVTEECVGSCGSFGGELYTGNLLRLYRKSNFLEHLGRDTGGHPKELLHYKIVCLNHLIDVASYAPPDIRTLHP